MTLRSGEVVRAERSRELVLAVVGHVGSGTSSVAKALRQALRQASNQGYDVHILKARDVIEEWVGHIEPHRLPQRPDQPTIEYTQKLQDCGDRMRQSDLAAIALQLIRKIRATRAEKQNRAADGSDAIYPDETPRAYIIDAIRHPAEVELFRSVYGYAFSLIGVVCDEGARRARLQQKFRRDGGIDAIAELMTRDAKAPEAHGQMVSKAFFLADIFVDNTIEHNSDGESALPVAESMRRVVSLLTEMGIQRPTPDETAMYHAYGAMMRSACLSRQVGCALIDKRGNILATGTNEAPRAGGGVYTDGDEIDHRCAYRKDKYCSNTREQNKIINAMFDGLKTQLNSILTEKLPQHLLELPGRANARGDIAAAVETVLGSATTHRLLTKALRDSRIGNLLEFSRAVHAEMDALLSAARKGISPVGARAFVTTFPCHYCARHLISAGVEEVQYIEPYPKSLAENLHSDAVTQSIDEWTSPSASVLDDPAELSRQDRTPKVLFRPFTGVAPRMYRRVFLEHRELKDPYTGELKLQPAAATGRPYLSRVSYAELEAKLVAECEPNHG